MNNHENLNLGYTVHLAQLWTCVPAINEEYWMPTLEGAYALAISIDMDHADFGYEPVVYDQDAGEVRKGWEDHANYLRALAHVEKFAANYELDRDFYPVQTVSA